MRDVGDAFRFVAISARKTMCLLMLNIDPASQMELPVIRNQMSKRHSTHKVPRLSALCKAMTDGICGQYIEPLIQRFSQEWVFVCE